MQKNFDQNGFTVENIFEKNDINIFENSFLELLRIQLSKLVIKFNLNKKNNIQYLVNLLKDNVPALNEVTYMMRNTSIGHKLAGNKNILNISKKLLKTNNTTPIISGPSFFINFPKKNILKYTWHSEQIWYPKRRNFLNIWCPIFEDRIKSNSMALKSKSHKKDWFYFSEYQGYDGVYDEKSLVQYEIPENFIAKFKTEIPKVRKNEGLFFNGKIVHRSIDTKINQILFTIVFRVYDYSNDLTLSANWADIPYNRKSFGIPNIKVKKD